ncbi:hypothetical protein A2867_00305 [Candidatus Daviesbacteria bacterium RIFCSPHIGHO2_01_FULL_40_11]|uniref:Uncharacterized protein n=1 Tax=Candidatus Daviesbacteria bacterium RIFCSPHIGHO2_01_FULL_40_11 TaxID=1797762 RepID=A0A1F5JLW2_9BACT|nr:MAG: hypothetical protein A2867_00305 [Candidatus Daviesbacteria bacterium RIFCSPHIGHO2_01_FULL_40_11]OGE62600.1 MAG: hypothetical protein A2964_00195 [Candidatus Daviesbacteria bacterium RIFCSPLOWO2_01_FULL_40_27]
MSKDKLISTITIVYFMIGFVFSVAFALYYRWPFLSFLSPGFYSVILTWPFQVIGFTRDLLTYGLAGKPI